MDGSSQRTASTLEFLEGSRSGIRYDADHLRGTDPADGRTLLARYDLAAVRDRLTPDVIAGRALAACAAAAGIQATVVMPADAPIANQQEAAICGARVILLDGLISDCGKLARLIAEQTGAFDMATLREPYRVEGKKTLGFELAEDFGWSLPDAVVYPTGGGTGLVGMWKAFDELEAIGLISSTRPRMFAVQADGCAPIVRAFEQGAEFAEPWPHAVTRAAGIRVPSALGDHLMLDCLRRSGGGRTERPRRVAAYDDPSVRGLLLWCAQNSWLSEHVPQWGFVKRAAKRFMPGEDFDSALKASVAFKTLGIGAVFSKLGENIKA